MTRDFRAPICAALALVLATGAAPAWARSGPPVPVAAAAAPVRDEAAAKLALARRFITAMQGEQLGASLAQMSGSMIPPNENLAADQNAAIRRAMEQSMADLLPRLFDAMAPVYADIFTMEELTALVNFYESDIGRSLMTKSLEAAPRISEIANAMMPEVLHDMMDTLCKEMGCTTAQRQAIDEELAQSGLALPPARSSAKDKSKGH